MADWSFVLCESPSPTNPVGPLVKVGDLSGARSKTLGLVKNRAGTCSFALNLEDDMAYEILNNVDLGDVRGTVRHCVKVIRNNVDLWSGPIWTIQGNIEDTAGTIQIGCVGWMETLQNRFLWSQQDFSAGGLGTPADQIVWSLMNTMNIQQPAHPLKVFQGGTVGTMASRIRGYPIGTNLGQAIQELSDVESGFDYGIDPTTRELNIASWDSYTTRQNIHFGYRWGPGNLQKLGWSEDASKTVNYMQVQSMGAPIDVQDSFSQDVYGMFEESVQLTQTDQSILAAYGNAELAVRAAPLLTYNLTPFPHGTMDSVPALFDDYQIGDKIFFSAEKGAFKVENQAIRVFGADISIDENGNELITTLQTSPSSGSG